MLTQKNVVPIVIVGLLLFGTAEMFIMSYVSVFIFITISTILSKSKALLKCGLIFAYFFVLTFQSVFAEIIFASIEAIPLYDLLIRRALGVFQLLLPAIITRYLFVSNYSKIYVPSIQEATAISFFELKSNSQKIAQAISELKNTQRSLSSENIMAIAGEIPRHNSFRYINNGTLTTNYFSEVENYLDIPFIYIVLSNTGSAASEVISVFTKQRYNHASISFDRDLKTTISYNGGERVYPPGLNQEMIGFLYKKENASVMVYSLPCTKEQKRCIFEQIKKINQEGSAYNMVGLVTKHSHKQNIMFCSQFVYSILKNSGLAYFKKRSELVTPSDLIEQDYYRKLSFEYKINLRSDAIAQESTTELYEQIYYN